jgi:hypothetical protein
MAQDSGVDTVMWILLAVGAFLFLPRLMAAFSQPLILTPQASGTLQLDKIMGAAGTGTASIVSDLFNSVDSQIG